MRFFALDPSINHVGWAICDVPFDEDSKTPVPCKICNWQSGMFELDKHSFTKRCIELWEMICLVLKGEGPDFYICEWPTFYNTMKGHIAAANNYTINLAGLSMFIAGKLDLPENKIHLITAPQWKGHTPKEVTLRRFYTAFGKNYLTSNEHAVDATMMLLWWLKEQAYVDIRDLFY